MQLPVGEKLDTLANACNFPLYIVGGYVRDFLAGFECVHKDIDICAPADADSFIAAAEKCGAKPTAVYKNTGTVKLTFGEEEYEFTCFRSDRYIRGTHKPVSTFLTDDIMLDARRRDFKCNAVYYDIKNRVTVDPLGGLKDIALGRITTVADADKVFGEDGLRLMRLARQAAQTGFTPSKECISGAKNNNSLISDVSPERICAELFAILHADARYKKEYGQYTGLKILDETRVLDFILPELTAGRGMEQPAEFHNYDVLEHSLRAVKYSDYSVRLAALLHDAGKPYLKRTVGNYHGHEKESARIAGEVGERLKMPKRVIGETVRLCATHMYDWALEARESKIRKFIVRNYDIFDKILLIKQADFSACKDNLSEAPCVTKWKEIYGKMKAEGAPMNLKQLFINGDDLLSLGAKPAEIGGVLENLLYDCALDGALNKRKRLLKRAQLYIGKNG